MTASEIYKPLFKLFANYEYKLNNAYVYDWESDFFAMSKSGYFLEVEIKVSRGDFFADFKKPKHLLFQDHIAKKSHHIFRNTGYDYSKEREIGTYVEKRIRFSYDGRQLKGRREYNWQYGRKGESFGYWVNDYGNHHINEQRHTIMAPCTSIKIKPLSEIDCPNNFYYATPVGLLKENELPVYAGLIEVDETGISIVKKAPYIHKAKQDITKILLSKFYNLWKYRTSWDEQINLSKTTVKT